MSCAWQKVGRSGQDDRIGRLRQNTNMTPTTIPYTTLYNWSYSQIHLTQFTSLHRCCFCLAFYLAGGKGTDTESRTHRNTLLKRREKQGCSPIYPAPRTEREGETEGRATHGRLGLSPPVPSTRHHKLHAANFTNVSICTAARSGWYWPARGSVTVGVVAFPSVHFLRRRGVIQDEGDC